jgi:hypothetical protein
MKTSIATFYITVASTFEWPVPDWVRRWLPTEEVDALLREEQALTDQLRHSDPADMAAPDNLEFLIEARIAANEPQRDIASRIVSTLIPVTALAAAAVLGFYLVMTPGYEPVEAPAMVSNDPVVIPSLDIPVSSVVQLASLAGSEKKNLLMSPLANEQDRLAADVTNALKYVAQGVVPDQYMDQVNRHLDSFNRGISSSI